MNHRFFFTLLFALTLLLPAAIAQDTVKIGLNYPQTGTYKLQGLDEFRAATLAVEQINAAGGIMGKKVQLVTRDSKSNPKVSVQNVTELIDKEGVKMIFGGVSSGVACAVGEVCQQKGVPFFGTITASNATTREKGHRHTFRSCYNAWMGAKALGQYLNKHYKNKKFFYIVSDYTWGWSSEKSIRNHTGTTDVKKHKRILTKLGGEEKEFKRAVAMAKMVKPDVLVMVLFGNDLTRGMRLATLSGLKKKSQIVVPLMELSLCEGAGPKVMEGVIGATDWNWQVPFKYGYKNGQKFVNDYVAKFNRYPGWGASCAYTGLYQFKSAAERAKSLEGAQVVAALENHEFTLLKDKQSWRGFDHQCVQSVFVVKCNPVVQVLKDKFKLNYFNVIDRFEGTRCVQTREEWNAARKLAGLPTTLEPLAGVGLAAPPK